LIHEPGSEPPEPPAWAKAIHITPQPA